MREVKIALSMIQNVVNKEREIEKGNLLANTMSYDITTLIPLLGETINSFFNVENTTLSISDIKVTNEMELYENFNSVEDISFNIYVTIAKSMVNPYTFTIYFSGNTLYIHYNITVFSLQLLFTKSFSSFKNKTLLSQISLSPLNSQLK